MTSDLEAFHAEFFQDVQIAANADGRFAADAFFELFSAQLVEAGELEAADRAEYVGARGIRIDGYGGTPTADGTLSLIVSDFSQEQSVQTLTATEMDATFKRAVTFLTRSRELDFRDGLDETSPGFGLADLIASSWRGIRKVRVFLISNRVLSARVDGRPAGEVDGRPIVYSVWDLGRLQRFVTSSRTREEMVIELGEHGGPIPVLPAHLSNAGYEAYLAVVPGTQLASVYERWGARLLEQNVRVFLQARGNINKGIKNTIENDPEMFFAYNNGITATAESIGTASTKAGLVITELRNFQIVNGGQTTASIHAASRQKAESLSRVFVQMKLSIVPQERALEVVPKISEYANSQNRVNAADFFSNHPFHVRIEEFSRRLLAPSADGTFRQSKWFYERARGQYQDAKAKLTQAERNRFDLEYPKKQMFTKTDLAKVLNTWACHPEIVSVGAQKNFGEFAGVIGTQWDTDSNVFNETYYRHAIAKIIVFRETEQLVSNRPWYQGGYRANIVTYGIAKVAYDMAAKGLSVDYDAIWRAQSIADDLREAVTVSVEAVRQVIEDPPAGAVKNVTEWAKKSGCWSRVADLRISWPVGWMGRLLTTEELKQLERSGVRDQKVLNGVEAQIAVVSAGAEVWRQVRAWGSERRLLSVTEAGILDVAAAMPTRMPTDRQCIVIVKLLERLRAEGCLLGPDMQ
jgi:hypothetical protein